MRKTSAECLCGLFKISVSGAFGDVRYCHCSQCRRKSGTAFTANAKVDSSQFALNGPQDQITEFEHKPGLFNGFCSRCGSPLYARSSHNAKDIRVRLGGFSDDIDVRITAHVRTQSKSSWYQIEDSLPCFDQTFEQQLEPAEAALLVVDMQSALVEGAYRQSETLAAINLAMQHARQANVSIIFMQHNHSSFAPMMKGNDGWQISSALEQQTADVVIEKQASDAFYQTRLERHLKHLGVKTLAICGMQTEYCIDATCKSALSKGLDVVLIADGHTTGTSILEASDIVAHHNFTLANLAHPTASLTAIPANELDFNNISKGSVPDS